MGLRMPIDIDKWSEIVSITLVYIQETLDELVLLQMSESNIINYFTRMYFDISRDAETEENKVLLEKINMFRENNRRIFVSTLDFLIAPLHQQIKNLNDIIDDPSIEAKEKLLNALNVQSRSELFIQKLYHEENDVVTDYLNLKNKQLQAFKEEKLKLEQSIRKIDDDRIDYLRNELSNIKL